MDEVVGSPYVVDAPEQRQSYPEATESCDVLPKQMNLVDE